MLISLFTACHSTADGLGGATMDNEISKEFSAVLSPLNIAGCHLKNRLGLGPINNGLFEEDGDAPSKCLSFFEQYFQDGLGLVYLGGVSVSKEGRSNKRALLLDSSEKCKGLRKVTSLAHSYGTKIVIQLMHAGRQTNPDEIDAQTVAPSPVPCPIVRKFPKELDHSGIQRIIRSFGQAALFAEQSGVDMIEIHGSHGYLISEFLSPYANYRTDEYGGSLENRFRFLSEIIEEIGKNVKIPVGLRINCQENVPNGLTLDEVLTAFDQIIKDRVAYVAVSAGFYSRNDVIIPSRKLGIALWRDEGAKLKGRLSIPVFLTGNIDTITLANELIAQQATDVALMVRALLSDPRIFSKTIQGNGNTAYACTNCMMCKYHSRGLPSVYCPFNPVLANIDKYRSNSVRS